MIYEIKDTNKISPLFGHWEETLIWSCLQGIMGKIYANDLTAERLHHEIYISYCGYGRDRGFHLFRRRTMPGTDRL